MDPKFRFNKKVLLVSNWAPPALGGPQNLYNIFSLLNGRQYAIYTSVINERNAETHVGSRLPCQYYFFDEEKMDPAYFTRPGTPLLIRVIGRIRRGILLPGRIVRIIIKGLRIIKKDHVDLLIGISDVGPALILTYVLSKMSGRPYMLYLFDLYKGNDLPQPWKFLSHIFEPILFKYARRVVVTNERTREYYMERYGKRGVFDVVHNSVAREMHKNVQTDYDPKPPFIILFTGRIYWAQERSVKNLLNVVSSMDDVDVKCLVYSPNPPKDLVIKYANDPRIVFDVAPYLDMPAIQSKADILFLPLSWNTASPQIISTASPGKLADYLMAGRPILIHAPPYAFVCQYAQQYSFAHVVDEEKSDSLKAGIKKLLFDTHYSRRLIKNAEKLFYEHHDSKPNAYKLASILNSI